MAAAKRAVVMKEERLKYGKHDAAWSDL